MTVRYNRPAPAYLDWLSTPRYNLCVSRRVVSTYTGPLIRVRRSNDNSETDIGFLPNDALDVASIAAHCTSNDGFVTTVYDQSSNAKNLTNGTNANQPKIWDGGTQLVLRLNSALGLAPALFFDGTNDVLSSTALNFTTGSPALSIAHISHSSNGFIWQIGDTTNALRCIRQTSGGTSTIFDIASTGSQTFNQDTTTPHRWLLTKASSATLNNFKLYKDDVLLTPDAVGTDNTLNMSNGNIAVWGARRTGTPSFANFFDGRSNFMCAWEAELTTAERMQLHYVMYRAMNRW